jgi:hypothetical protein
MTKKIWDWMADLTGVSPRVRERAIAKLNLAESRGVVERSLTGIARECRDIRFLEVGDAVGDNEEHGPVVEFLARRMRGDDPWEIVYGVVEVVYPELYEFGDGREGWKQGSLEDILGVVRLVEQETGMKLSGALDVTRCKTLWINCG